MMKNIYDIFEERRYECNAHDIDLCLENIDIISNKIYDELTYMECCEQNVTLLYEYVDLLLEAEENDGETNNNKFASFKDKIKNRKKLGVRDTARLIKKMLDWFNNLIQSIVDHFTFGKQIILKCGGRKKVIEALKHCDVGVKLTFFQDINEFSIPMVDRMINKLYQFKITSGTEEELNKALGIENFSEIPKEIASFFVNKDDSVIPINKLDVNAIVNNVWNGGKLKRTIERARKGVIEDLKNENSSLENHFRNQQNLDKGKDKEVDEYYSKNNKNIVKNGKLRVKYANKILSCAVKYCRQVSMNCKAIITKAYSKYHNKYNRVVNNQMNEEE